jgi:hypothetical protein
MVGLVRLRAADATLRRDAFALGVDCVFIGVTEKRDLPRCSPQGTSGRKDPAQQRVGERQRRAWQVRLVRLRAANTTLRRDAFALGVGPVYRAWRKRVKGIEPSC